MTIDKKILEEQRKYVRKFVADNQHIDPKAFHDKFNKKGFFGIINKKTGEIDKKSNLIVYNGRAIEIQRLFGINRTTTDVQNLTLSWISFGVKGTQNDNLFAPIPPNPTDTTLQEEIVVDATNSTYADNGKKIPFNLTYLQDDKNNNEYLIAELLFELNDYEANGTFANDISECGLWFSDSKDATLASIFELWARVTFVSKRKDINNEYAFFWYTLV